MQHVKYQTTDDAKILGVALVSIVDNLKVKDFIDIAQDFGFDQIEPDKWYSFQKELDFMKALSERENSTQNMIAIGIRIFDKLVLPPDIRRIEDGINMLNEIIKMNMCDVPPNSDYAIETMSDNHIRVTDRTSFPHDLVYGYLYGLCKNLLPFGHKFSVQREYINPNNPDSAGAYYDISWD